MSFRLLSCVHEIIALPSNFRFGGEEFPPLIFFKIYTHTAEGKGVKYISGRKMIKPATEVNRFCLLPDLHSTVDEKHTLKITHKHHNFSEKSGSGRGRGVPVGGVGGGGENQMPLAMGFSFPLECNM